QDACSSTTYEAENMFHSTGGSTPDGWNIWANGYISTNHNFDGGTHLVTIVTRGQAAAGVPAHLSVSIENRTYTYSITDTAWTSYRFNLDIPAGVHEIRVAFDNDYNQGGQDRNLYVDKVIVGCAGGWTNLTLRNGWTAAANSNVPAVGLVDGIVTFRGALDGSNASSNIPFCLSDGHTSPGPDYTQYRPADVGYLTTRLALANGATGSVLIGPALKDIPPSPDREQTGSFCLLVNEHGAEGNPGPNARLLTSLEGLTYTKSAYGVTKNAYRVLETFNQSWSVDYPQRGTDETLPGGSGIHAKVVNGFVRFQGEARYLASDPFDSVLFRLPANQGLIPSEPVYLPITLDPVAAPLPGRIVIQTNGDVVVEGAVDGAKKGTSLDGASYSISQASGTAFPLSNGWIASSTRLVRARLANGVVRLEGAVKSGTTATIGTLPTTMRPAKPIYLVADGFLFAQPATLRVNTDGTIEVVTPLVVAQPGISLDGVSFAVDGPYQCTGGCLTATPLARNQNSGSFNTTGERWFVVSDSINGWQASEMAGRTIRVNGVVVTPGQMPLPAPVNGTTYYFNFSAGSRTWASWSFW
ncbi:MAG TPA: carbohydrate-binding domain-containing protein, partial [Polyangiaceae bacterium]